METQATPSSRRALFENHLEFLATHRGTVTRLKDAVTVESDRPEFTFAALDKGADRSLLDLFTSVRLIPLSEPWDQTLADPRFQARGGLSYMTFEGGTAAWPKHPELEIVRVSDARQMADFSHVQAAGFEQKPGDYAHWHPWLHQFNQKNLRNERQGFYVGYLRGKPVGTALVIRTQTLGGIYGLATLAEARKQGVGAALLARAIADARSASARLITLQVAEGSYAERLYEKLGFKKQFSAKILSR